MEGFKYKEETHDIIGAAMAVHRYFGAGFAEKVYQDALEVEFCQCDISYLREHSVFAEYKGERFSTEFIPDFICYDKIIVEMKAVQELTDVHRSQALNYAKVGGYEQALLINFGQPSLQFERFIVSRRT